MMNTAPSATIDAFARAPLPKRFCNLDRLLHAMKARGLDGIVATWRDLNKAYACAVTELGGFVRDPARPGVGSSARHRSPAHPRLRPRA
jgi:hypothetical protein